MHVWEEEKRDLYSENNDVKNQIVKRVWSLLPIWDHGQEGPDVISSPGSPLIPWNTSLLSVFTGFSWETNPKPGPDCMRRM